MRKFFRSILFFLVLIVVLSYPCALFISHNFYTYSKQNWILRNKEGIYDYAVIGSSRVLNMVDIYSLDSTWNKKGINLGTSGSCYAENFILLSEFTTKNKIRQLLLNVDEFCFSSRKSYSYPFHEFEFLPLFNSKYDSIFRDYFPAWKFNLWKILPVSPYCEYNANYVIKRPVSNPVWTDKKGAELFNPMDKTNNHGKLIITKKRPSEIDSLDKFYFLKILNFCHTRKIGVILITTPVHLIHKSDTLNTVVNTVIKFPGAVDLPYINFHSFYNAFDAEYFNDLTHTNTVGSIKYSYQLGEQLKKRNL